MGTWRNQLVRIERVRSSVSRWNVSRDLETVREQPSRTSCRIRGRGWRPSARRAPTRTAAAYRWPDWILRGRPGHSVGKRRLELTSMAPTLATQTVGVIGSGTFEHEECARAVGEMLADFGVNLLTGGGRGVMTSVSRAFTQRHSKRGIC